MKARETGIFRAWTAAGASEVRGFPDLLCKMRGKVRRHGVQGKKWLPYAHGYADFA
jgi:hypothetical protein